METKCYIYLALCIALVSSIAFFLYKRHSKGGGAGGTNPAGAAVGGVPCTAATPLLATPAASLP